MRSKTKMSTARTLIFRSSFVLALSFLSFLYGGVAYVFQLPAGVWLKRSIEAATAYYNWFVQYSDVLETNLWRETEVTVKGVTRYDQTRAFNGYTLYVSAHEQSATLINMEGTVVYRWSLPSDKIWDKPLLSLRAKPREFMHYRDVRLLPDGSLLSVFSLIGTTPYGFGLAKINARSDLIWSYPHAVHHEFDLGPDGRIYVLVQWINADEVDSAAALNSTYLDDAIAILAPNGEEIDRMRIADAFQQSPYQSALAEMAGEDPLHTNSIKVVSPAFAAKVPFARAGDLLISIRHLSLLAIIRPETRAVVWATLGPWKKQHHAVPLENGRILLFDNLGKMGPNGRSRVLEFDPMTLGVTWSFSGTAEHPFDSEIRGEAERLANGNTLLVESDRGRILEVTTEGEVVWEYVNPIRGKENDKLLPVILSAERISEDQVAFLKD